MARGAGYAAFLGAALIGVAVIIGIVLLQIGDTNDNGPASAQGPKSTTTSTTTTTTRPTSGTTKPTPQRPPNEVSLIVLNAGAATGKAGDMRDTLARKGYTNSGKANDWTGHKQTGNTVYCRAGLGREGSALAIAVGSNAQLTIPYPTPPPPYSSGKDCVVVVGAPK